MVGDHMGNDYWCLYIFFLTFFLFFRPFPLIYFFLQGVLKSPFFFLFRLFPPFRLCFIHFNVFIIWVCVVGYSTSVQTTSNAPYPIPNCEVKRRWGVWVLWWVTTWETTTDACTFFFWLFFSFFDLFLWFIFFCRGFWKLLFVHFVSRFSPLNRCLYSSTSEIFLSECCIYLSGWFGLSIDQKVDLVCHISKSLVLAGGCDNHFRCYGVWR